MFAIARKTAAAAFDKTKSIAIVGAVQMLKENQKAELQAALGKASSSATAEPFREFYSTLTTLLDNANIEAAKSFRTHRNALKDISYETAQTDWDTLMSTLGALAEKDPKASKKFNETFENQVGAFRRCAADRAAAGGAQSAGAGDAGAGAAAAMTAGAGSSGGTASPQADAAMIAGAAASTGESASPSVLAAQSAAGNTGTASPPPQFGVDPLLRGASARTVFSGKDGAELRHQLVADCKKLFKCDDVDGVSQAASRVYQYLDQDQDQDRSDAVELETIECLVLMYQAVAEAISNGDIYELNSIRDANLKYVFITLIEEGLFSELAEPFYTGLWDFLTSCEGDEARGDVQAFIYELLEQYNAACEVQESIVDLGGFPCFSGA